MTRVQQKKIFTGIEMIIFLWLGILLLGSVAQNITRFFVVHRLKPFIAITGIWFIVWAVQNMCVLSSSENTQTPDDAVPLDHAYYIHIGMCLIILVFVSAAVYQYRNTETVVTKTELDQLVQRYPVSPNSNTEDPADSSNAADEKKSEPHTLITGSGVKLSGYYPEDKEIIVDDTEVAGWVNEIAVNTTSYTGWKITVKGCVVTDTSVFTSGEFCPARELMTCCVADLSVIGLTCTYDEKASYAGLIKEGTWVSVTGTLVQGEFQGEPEPQISSVTVVKAKPPEDPYVYPM